ncbi:hypothetical protein SAMD00019534_083960 [Acytostelium subglobosum LB1]|uniref:hypothetical protein n=1 Tax=Acytostelium subglobosum LB1 TaxID=1410327 RepID=UPI000644AA59|nr:hypothetical protein SAMD00019534_083960 [Acytostelium subglobosum LB1]GAM25221.1 hypothetical protein SAMD00019534_083960 [Acytostelium subglobosum LB1]|eukprot:XP_012751741.1 hypothetical protein SAMD00019534_083960 [Acytostelium subglobosum LB1]
MNVNHTTTLRIFNNRLGDDLWRTDNKLKMHIIFNNYHLFRYLLSKLDSNIDRLCISLTCKHLYNNREQYLRFEQSSPFTVDAEELLQYSTYTLKSYESLLSQSVSNVNCFISVASIEALETVPSYCTTLDFNLDEHTRDVTKIPRHIHTLFARHTKNNMYGELPTSITRLKLDMHGYNLLRLAGEAFDQPQLATSWPPASSLHSIIGDQFEVQVSRISIG